MVLIFMKNEINFSINASQLRRVKGVTKLTKSKIKLKTKEKCKNAKRNKEIILKNRYFCTQK